MPAISPCEYEEIKIESDSGKTIDLRLGVVSVSYTHLLAHETVIALV